MKKLLITLILGFMLIPIASPFVMANETSETTEETTEATIVKPLIPKPDFLPGPNSLNIDGSTVSGEDTQNYILNTTIPRVINILLGLFGIGTFLAILFSAVTMLTAWGNEDKVTKAKRNLQYAIIGFLVSLLSYAIVSIIVSLALPSQEVSNQTSFIEYLVPSAYANSIDVNTLFPTENDLIENQGDGVSLPSGDLVTEVIPALVTNLMFAVGFLIFIGFLYGGVLLVYGRGNEEVLTKAKDIIMYSAIAVGLLGFGYAIVYGIATLNFDQDTSTTLDDVYVDPETTDE